MNYKYSMVLYKHVWVYSTHGGGDLNVSKLQFCATKFDSGGWHRFIVPISKQRRVSRQKLFGESVRRKLPPVREQKLFFKQPAYM